jgi:hypothetical protein
MVIAMKKADFLPLWPPGIHSVTLDELQAVAVTPFLSDARRAIIFASFKQWIQKLQFLEVHAILWIDGSFLTAKYGPDDIDCIMWNPSAGKSLTDDQKLEVRALTDRSTVARRFHVDFYMEAPSPGETLHRQAYFKGLFGFQYDGKTPKGFVELRI